MHSLLLVAALLARLPSPTTDRAEALAKDALAKGHDVRAAAPLIRLHGLLDEVDDLNLLAEPYAALMYRQNTDAHVRTLARLFYADVERARGRTVKGREQLDTLDFVQDWWVVGGFDNEGKAGCDTDFGPEAALDLRSVYPAKGKDVAWRRLPAKPWDGFSDLSTVVRPASGVVAYAATVLQADVETKANLSVGTSGGVRVFVNGVKVLASDVYNLPREGQKKLRVTLRKGNNRVLVKVCHEKGPLGFFFRASRAEGVKGTIKPVAPDVMPPLEKGPAPQPQPLPTLAEALAAKVKATPKDAALRADLATVLAWSRATGDAERIPALEATKAADDAPDDVELQLTAATLVDDANERRRFLTRALAKDAAHPYARLLFGQYELAKDHHIDALRAAERLVADFPSFGQARLLQARALDALGERTASLLATEAAFRALPLLPPVAREAVAAARRQEHHAEAVARARAAVALRFDDSNTRRALANHLVDLGQLEDGLEQYRKVLQLEPLDVSSQLKLGELYAANGRTDEARAAFEQAQALAPEEPDVFEREGRALLHTGLRDEALRALTQALALRPQNPALRDALRTLRGEEPSSATPHALAAAPLLEAAQKHTGEDAVYLADVTAVRVQTSGLSSRFSQLVVKVLTDRGVEAFRQLPISFSPDRQEVRILKARVTKPDKSVVESFGDSEQAMNEPWTGMYYDARARLLSFPALAPGDVLEVQWRVEDTASDNLLSDYWGDVDLVQTHVPKLHYRYVVDMPKERPLFWNKATLPAWVTAASEAQGDRVLYRFSADDVAKVVPEPNMPGWAEVATPVHVSTYAKWDDVGRYYWGLVREQLVPNDELKKTVEQVLAGVDRKDTAKVVAAVYGFVVTNTRYVALEFGIHGYKPYRVAQVLSRRFGDCKDKASLIVSMLKVAGVDARLVLLRMRHLGRLAPEPASLSAFNHAIAYVPALGLYLDGTAEFHGSRELPTADRLANVVVVEPDGKSDFATTPEAKPEDNTSTLVLDVKLAGDGSAKASGSLSATGQAAPELRRTYQTPATRAATFEQQWAQSFPGLTAEQLTMTDVKQLEQPATLSFQVSLPRYAEASPGGLRFFPFGSARAFLQALAPLTERRHPVLLSGVWKNVFRFTYTPPPGFAVGSLDGPAEERSAFGSFALTTTKRDDGALVVEGTLELSRARVETAEYGQFREWLAKVDQLFGKRLTLARQGAQTALQVPSPR